MLRVARLTGLVALAAAAGVVCAPTAFAEPTAHPPTGNHQRVEAASRFDLPADLVAALNVDLDSAIEAGVDVDIDLDADIDIGLDLDVGLTLSLL